MKASRAVASAAARAGGGWGLGWGTALAQAIAGGIGAFQLHASRGDEVLQERIQGRLEPRLGVDEEGTVALHRSHPGLITFPATIPEKARRRSAARA